MSGECPHSRRVEDAEGEVVCQDCGLVLSDRPISPRPEWRAYTGEERLRRSRVGPPGGPVMPTLVGYGDKDGRGQRLARDQRAAASKLRLWTYRVGYEQRKLVAASASVDMVCQALHLPEIVKTQAQSLYRKALAHKFQRGRSVLLLATACVYAACKQQGFPRSLYEVAQPPRVGKIQLQTCYRDLYWLLDLKPAKEDPSRCLNRIMNQLGIEGDARTRAQDLLEKAKRHGLLQGRNVASVAAACVYVAEVAATQREIGDVAHVTEVTVRNRCKELKRLL